MIERHACLGSEVVGAATSRISFRCKVRAKKLPPGLLLGSPFSYGEYDRCDSVFRSLFSRQAEHNGIFSESLIMPLADLSF
jgi:hypothetical protein